MSEGTKHDSNKLRLDLVPIEATEAIARAMTYGANKYGDYNWSQGINHSRLYAAALRHMTAYFKGEDIDTESGNHHLDHALASLAMLKASVQNKLGSDDRPIYMKQNGIPTYNVHKAVGDTGSEEIMGFTEEARTQLAKDFVEWEKSKKKKELKLEVGKFYKTREGDVAQITRCSSTGLHYPYFASNGFAYTENGTFQKDIIKHHLDLVEEVTNE